MFHVRQEPGELVVEFSGPLDVRAADELVSIVLQQPAGRRLVVDISRASTVYDLALGRLVDGLPSGEIIRGTSERQLRLLHCLEKHRAAKRRIRAI